MNTRIVGTLSAVRHHPVERLPDGFIALFVSDPNIYRWEVIRAADVVRVAEGARDGYHVVNTATLQQVLDALIAAAGAA